MKNIFLVLTLLTSVGFGAIERRSLDIKLPTQAVLERQTISAGVSTTSSILSASAGPTSAAATTISTFLAQPDVPRNLILTPTGTTGDVESCVVTITGTNVKNSTISETFTFAANASTAVTGSKAFKTVTSVAFPANCESGSFGATWNLGQGYKLGLRNCMANAGSFFHAVYGGVKEVTAPTVAASASAVESNTIQLNSMLLGSDVIAYYVQNFACSP